MKSSDLLFLSFSLLGCPTREAHPNESLSHCDHHMAPDHFHVYFF